MKFSTIKKFAKYFSVYLLIPLILFFAGAFSASYSLVGYVKKLNHADNWYNEEAGGLNESKYIQLGGVEQFVRIRSRNLNNPVLLDLHGGPGGAVTDITFQLFRPMTEYFTLVEWDQRGAGKSRGDDDAALIPTMSFERMVDDTIELIEYIQKRLGVKKVIILGHSWGSKLGLGVAKKRPDLLHAFVGSGQSLGWRSGFDESKRLMIEAAAKAGDTETLDALQSVPDEWPPNDDWLGNWRQLIDIQSHLGRNSYYTTTDASIPDPGIIYRSVIFSPESSTIMGVAAFAYLNGFLPQQDLYNVSFSPNQALIQSMLDLNLAKDPEYYRFEVPIIIFQGEHDFQTPTTLVEEWFPKVEAPFKSYVAFENSGHYIITEEPAKFFYTLIDLVRPLALEEPDQSDQPDQPDQSDLSGK